VNGVPIEWHLEHEHCSVFQLVMRHWKGTFDLAMIQTGTAAVWEELVNVWDWDWHFVG
jgi:hypothetical protein